MTFRSYSGDIPDTNSTSVLQEPGSSFNIDGENGEPHCVFNTPPSLFLTLSLPVQSTKNVYANHPPTSSRGSARDPSPRCHIHLLHRGPNRFNNLLFTSIMLQAPAPAPLLAKQWKMWLKANGLVPAVSVGMSALLALFAWLAWRGMFVSSSFSPQKHFFACGFDG